MGKDRFSSDAKFRFLCSKLRTKLYSIRKHKSFISFNHSTGALRPQIIIVLNSKLLCAKIPSSTEFKFGCLIDWFQRKCNYENRFTMIIFFKNSSNFCLQS